MRLLDKFKSVTEAEVGSGTSIKDTQDQQKRAKLNLQAAELRLKQEKERIALQKKKSAVKVKEEADMTESFSASQIAALKAEYSKINTIDPSGDAYKKLIAMLDRLDAKSLEALANAGVKFVSKLAQNRVARRKPANEGRSIKEYMSDKGGRYVHKGTYGSEKSAAAGYSGHDDDNKPEIHPKDKAPAKKGANQNRRVDTKLYKKEDVQIAELSNEKLGDYKKKAGEAATAADKAGDAKKGNKRFSGIMKATRKQFDNDAKQGMSEASQRVDSLVTDALKIMQGSELKDAVQALKTVLGDREYNGRRGFYNLYVKQLVDMYGKKTNEELSPKQKEIDKNKNGKIDGFDLAHLRKKTEELSPKQKELDKNKNGKIDGTDLAHLRDKKKPQGADFAAQRRKERMASNGRMDEESINETGGPKVFQKDNKHIEKYSDDKFWLYVDNKKTKEFSSLEMAKAAALKEHFDLQEKSDYEVYHKDYSGAVQTAIKQAEKRGFEVDMDDWHDKVATGPKKPSSGKTNSFSINLMKDGKPSKKKLQMQVYNMDNQKYELNMYIEEVQLGESDAYDKNVKPSNKPHDKDAAAKRAVIAARAARKAMANRNEAKDISINATTKKITKGQTTKTGVAKWLGEPTEEKVPEFKTGGDKLAKKFDKAFKSLGIKSNVKIKTVNNISMNEIDEEKKDGKEATANDKKKSIKQGEKLSGKQEPITIDPELNQTK